MTGDLVGESCSRYYKPKTHSWSIVFTLWAARPSNRSERMMDVELKRDAKSVIERIVNLRDSL
jgi:hypothetical protein